MAGGGKAVLISEVGWRGMRELSLKLVKEGLFVDVMIKGRVEKEVMALITRPKGLRLYAVPRKVFRPYLFFYFLWHRIWGGLDRVVVSKEETGKWLKGFGFKTEALIETEEGYRLRNKDREGLIRINKD